MKNIYLLAFATFTFGCNPPVPPTPPAAQRTVTNPVVQTQMSAPSQSDEQLRNELADLIVRRSAAYDVLNELDQKGVEAIDKKDSEASDASMQLYITTGEKLIELEDRINEIDQQLGTQSNRKYSESDKAANIKRTNDDIAAAESYIKESKASLEEAVKSNSIDRHDYPIAIRYGELKLKLLKLQLKNLN